MTTGKVKSDRPVTSAGGLEPEALQTAQEIHTLAQRLFAELAVTRPWLMAGTAPGIAYRIAPAREWPAAAAPWAGRVPWTW